MPETIIRGWIVYSGGREQPVRDVNLQRDSICTHNIIKTKNFNCFCHIFVSIFNFYADYTQQLLFLKKA